MQLFYKGIIKNHLIPTLILLVFFADHPAHAADDRIETIRFTGNKQTKESIMLQEMDLHPGEPLSPHKLERARQAIMDLGLFSSVKVRTQPGETGRIVEFEVKEKYYIVPLPTLDRTADGEIRYGGYIKADNLNGLNQYLKLTYEAERGCCGEQNTTHSLDATYYYPRVFGSYYNSGISFAHSRSPLESVAPDGERIAEHYEYRNRINLTGSRWLNAEHASTGWNASITAFWRHVGYVQASGFPLSYDNEAAVGLTFGIGYTEVHNHLYSRSGMQYGWESEHGLEQLGSDSHYTRNQLYYRHYIPLGPIPKHINLNLQTRMGISSGNIPLSSVSYSLGGSGDLRGYQKDETEGISYFVQNFEFLTPLFGHAPARGVLFADFGNAYETNKVLDVKNIKTTYGTGLRYQFESFIDLQLRIDYAYATDINQRKFYLGSKSTF